MSSDELETAVMSLPEKECARLAHKLIASIDDRPEGDVAEEWIREIDRRSEEIMSGEVDLIPGDEVFRKAFERLRRK